MEAEGPLGGDEDATAAGGGDGAAFRRSSQPETGDGGDGLDIARALADFGTGMASWMPAADGAGDGGGGGGGGAAGSSAASRAAGRPRAGSGCASSQSSRPLTALQALRGSRADSGAVAAQIEGFGADFLVGLFQLLQRCGAFEVVFRLARDPNN